MQAISAPKQLNNPKKRDYSTANSVKTGGKYCVTISEYKAAKKEKCLCGDFGNLAEHLHSFTAPASVIKSGRKCSWCGKVTYTQCTICNVALHNYPAKGKNIGLACSVYYHDEMYFGLGYMDTKTLDSKRGVKWHAPSKTAKKNNRQHVKFLKTKV